MVALLVLAPCLQLLLHVMGLCKQAYALCAGELHDQLQRRGKLPVEDARFYAAEIVEILGYLRQQKVCHGVKSRTTDIWDKLAHLQAEHHETAWHCRWSTEI